MDKKTDDEIRQNILDGPLIAVAFRCPDCEEIHFETSMGPGLLMALAADGIRDVIVFKVSDLKLMNANDIVAMVRADMAQNEGKESTDEQATAGDTPEVDHAG